MLRKKWIWLFCCFGLISKEAFFQESFTEILANPNKKVLVAAHRGDWKNFPENSIPGVQSCIQQGIDIVEIDVQETKDGKFVLMHDPSVNRTTNGKGRVSDYLFSEVQRLRLKDRFGDLTDYHVPSLDTILKLCNGKIIVNIDKSGGRFQKLFKVIDSLDCGRFVIMKDNADVSTFSELNNPTDAYCMPILSSSRLDVDSFIIEIKPPLVEFILKSDTSRYVTEEWLRFFQEHQCRLWYNALFKGISGGHVEDKNTIDSWKWFISHGAYIIQTDNPFHLMTYLVENGYHPQPTKYTPRSLNSPPFSEGMRMKQANNSEKSRSEKESNANKYYKVRKGDTLQSIAKRNHLRIEELLKLNKGLKKGKKIIPGQKIRIK
jgi:glycerophosphoryl diester phosphodiesterase